MIDSLLINSVRTSDPDLILLHVRNFFSSLLAEKPASGLRISSSLWSARIRVSGDENDALLLPLSDDEVEASFMTSKSYSAPRPDGLSVSFFKQFWPVLRGLVSAVVQGFCLGTVDLSRLNYVVLTLIPKVKGADSVS